MRAARGGVAVAAALLLGAACAAPHAFERGLDEGRYEDAARAFESDSTLWTSPEALLRAGRVYADPALPTFDVARARSALDRLARDFPASEEAALAAPLLGLLGALDRIGGELLVLKDSSAASREAAERDLQVVRRRVEQLERDLREVRSELERLKAIDLRPRPNRR